MAYKDPEKKKEYDRKRYKENRERELLRVKKWQKDNPEKKKISKKKSYEKNREKNLKYQKQYTEQNPEKHHKCYTISNWKARGLIVDDEDEYESIYYLVMSTENCEGCECILTESKPQTSTSRCMDHDHITGEFRAVLCIGCNSKQPRQHKQIINNTNIDNGI